MMKKKTIYYPPVEHVTLPQFARHAQQASAVALKQAPPTNHDESRRAEIRAEFAAAQRRQR